MFSIILLVHVVFSVVNQSLFRKAIILLSKSTFTFLYAFLYTKIDKNKIYMVPIKKYSYKMLNSGGSFCVR